MPPTHEPSPEKIQPKWRWFGLSFSKFSDSKRSPFGDGYSFDELTKHMKDWWFP